MRFLLLPLSYLYGAIAALRNMLYDKGIFKSYRSPLKTVVVGNLQVGGSGKTPMTAWLYDYLSPNYKTAILSRGYGRSTKGLLVADASSSADSIGDEPLWYYQHLPNVQVVVSEKRQLGLQYLESTSTELVLLDDAFQHRAITANVYLMLSEYSRPYYTDFPMPYGRLREFRHGVKRAHAIIITKCPAQLNLEEKIAMIKAINPEDHQSVFFTGLKTGTPIGLKGADAFDVRNFDRIIALSGIASPASFHAFCQSFGLPVEVRAYGDHHHYTEADIHAVLKLVSPRTCIICTEKDAVKLKSNALLNLLPENAIFSLPVRPYFLFEEKDKFKRFLKAHQL